MAKINVVNIAGRPLPYDQGKSKVKSAKYLLSRSTASVNDDDPDILRYLRRGLVTETEKLKKPAKKPKKPKGEDSSPAEEKGGED